MKKDCLPSSSSKTNNVQSKIYQERYLYFETLISKIRLHISSFNEHKENNVFYNNEYHKGIEYKL